MVKPNASQPRLERDKTDEGLRSERSSTDEALEHARASIEDTADDIVARARDKADSVLDAARGKADQKLEASGAAPTGPSLARERAGEDAILKEERSAEDESLYREREQQARILKELLPLEREKTDQYLLIERARSDDSLANRDDFLGIVSHDLRDLLGSMALRARLLSAQATDSEEGKRTVAEMERMQHYVARMNRIVGDLVDVVSIDSGKLAVHPKDGDAAELIAEAVDAFARSAHEKGVSLVSEVSETSLSAAFDHDRLFQVLANLIANAIKFTPEGGLVKVRGERTADELHISVIDTGIGIPAGRLGAVFERFWQAGGRDHRGLGLGLYISKCIVDAHGGRIWAESKPGAGSVLRLLISCASK